MDKKDVMIKHKQEQDISEMKSKLQNAQRRDQNENIVREGHWEKNKNN